MRFIGWSSVLHGVLVSAVICLIGCSPYNQQPTSPNQQAVSPIAGDLQTGVHAFDKGDYATALKKLKPLAEQGNSTAQVTLGLMYYQANGVAKDYHEALKWFLRAAEQGEQMAQLSLGFLYAAGEGVDQDFVQAYMRLSLCLSDPNVGANCRKNRELVSRRMTPAQIAEGEGLARAWKRRAYVKE